MSDDTENVKVLRIAIDELRRVHDNISNTYDQLRIKALSMVAGEVAIAAFLFADQNAKILFPSELSGQVFFVAGFVGLFVSFGLLIRSIASGDWYIPGDMDEIEQIDNGSDNRYDTTEKFLLFLRKDYLDANRKCADILNKRAEWVNWGLYVLLASVIILIALKYGGTSA